MPIQINVDEQHVGAFSKLRCLISIMGGNCQEQTPGVVVNNIAKVQLHFRLLSSGSPMACNILVVPLDPKDKLQVIVSCQETDVAYCAQIYQNKWTEFGKKQCDIAIDKFRTSLLNIIIFATKIDEPCLAKMYNDQDYTDFSLRAADGSVAVHRVILAAHSDVFRAMLSHEWKENTEGHIQVEGVTVQTLEHFKEYMYLRRLPADGLKQLLLLASYYLIDELKADCISRLVFKFAHNKTEELSSLLEFAVENKLTELVSSTVLVSSAVARDNPKKAKIEDSNK